MNMTATQRAAYNRRLGALEDRYQAGELSLDQLNAAVTDLDAEWHDRCERADEDRRERMLEP